MNGRANPGVKDAAPASLCVAFQTAQTNATSIAGPYNRTSRAARIPGTAVAGMSREAWV